MNYQEGPESGEWIGGVRVDNQQTEKDLLLQCNQDDTSYDSMNDNFIKECLEDIQKVEQFHVELQIAENLYDFDNVFVPYQAAVSVTAPAVGQIHEEDWQNSNRNMMENPGLDDFFPVGFAEDCGGAPVSFFPKLSTMNAVAASSESRYIEIKDLHFFPPQQLVNTRVRSVNVVLINRGTNEYYAFDQQEISLTEEKQYNINEVIQLPSIRSFIDEASPIYLIQDESEIEEIYIGTYPIKESAKRFQRIGKSGEIKIKYLPASQLLHRHDNQKGQFIKEGVQILKIVGTGEKDEEKRVNERSVKEALQHVQLWRRIQKEVNNHLGKGYHMISLERVAEEYKGCKKKTLDYYNLELRRAERANFIFADHLEDKMGLIRAFNLELKEKGLRFDRQKELKFQFVDDKDNLPIPDDIIKTLLSTAIPNKKMKQQQGMIPISSGLNDEDDEEEPERILRIDQKTKIIKKTQNKGSPKKSTVIDSSQHKFSFTLKPSLEKQTELSSSQIRQLSFNNEQFQNSTNSQSMGIANGSSLGISNDQFSNGGINSYYDSTTVNSSFNSLANIYGSQILTNQLTGNIDNHNSVILNSQLTGIINNPFNCALGESQLFWGPPGGTTTSQLIQTNPRDMVLGVSQQPQNKRQRSGSLEFSVSGKNIIDPLQPLLPFGESRFLGGESINITQFNFQLNQNK